MAQNPYLDILLEILSESESGEECDENPQETEQSLEEVPRVQEAEDVPQGPAVVSPTRARVSSIYKHLSSGSARKKMLKMTHCHFCHTDCDKHQLRNHLGQREHCLMLYMRKSRVKSLDAVFALLWECEFCDIKIHSLRSHLDTADGEQCKERYFNKFGVQTSREVVEKVAKLKKTSYKSRQKLQRQFENLNSKRKRRVKMKLEPMSTFMNSHNQKTLFSNFKHCLRCMSDLLVAEEVNETSDIVKTGQVILSGKEDHRRMGSFWICELCKQESSDPDDDYTEEPTIKTFHYQGDSDVGVTFVPKLDPTQGMVDNVESNESFHPQDSYIMLPNSMTCLNFVDKNIKFSSMSTMKIQKIIFGSSKVDNRVASLIYENQINKYAKAKYNSDIFTGSVQDNAARTLSSLKQISKEKEIAGSLSWVKAQEREINSKMWQFGENCLRINLTFVNPDLQSTATQLIQNQIVVTASMVGDGSREQKVRYFVHTNHSNEVNCGSDCVKIPLAEFLETNPTRVSTSTFLSSVEQRANSIISNIIRSPASPIEAEDYHFTFKVDNSGNVMMEGVCWPLFMKMLNQSQCDITDDSKETLEEVRLNCLESLKKAITPSSNQDVVQEINDLSNQELDDIIGLVKQNQVHLFPINDDSTKEVLHIPSLEWLITEFSEEDSVNIEDGRLLVKTVRNLLSLLPTEKIQNGKTSDWLEELWGSVEDPAIEEPDLFKFQFEGMMFKFKLTNKLNIFIQKYDACPMLAVFQYSLTNVEDRLKNRFVMKRRHLIDCFTSPFTIPLLKATAGPINIDIISHVGQRLTNKEAFNNYQECLNVGLEGHKKMSFLEAFSLMDKNKLKVKSSCSVENVYTGPGTKFSFKRVQARTEKSFTLEGVQGYFELLPSSVSRYFKRKNGQLLLLCEFCVYYEFLGTDKSAAKYEVYKDQLNKIESSEDSYILSDTEFLPDFIILEDNEVMQKRKTPKCLMHPEFFDEFSKSHSDVLLFCQVDSLESLTKEKVQELINERTEGGEERKVTRNKRTFLKKMRTSRL